MHFSSKIMKMNKCCHFEGICFSENIAKMLVYADPEWQTYTWSVIIYTVHESLHLLKLLTYARYFWPFNSEGSLACHVYCDTEHPFLMVLSEDPWHSHPLPSVWQFCKWAAITCFNDLGLSQLGFEHATFRFRGERSIPLRHHRGSLPRRP